MEEALAIFEYLPVSFKSEEEQAYIAFLWDAFKVNYEREQFQFAYLAFHMLTMCAVYCNVWQIKCLLADDFSKAMVGFNRNVEEQLIATEAPFAIGRLERMGESATFRFLKLLGCDNKQIQDFTKLVRDRNGLAHATGEILLRTQATLDHSVAEALKTLSEIQARSQRLITHSYEEFLKESAIPDTREYVDDIDQLREILILNNYFCLKDIEHCLKYDIHTLQNDPNFDGIVALHQVLIEEYGNGVVE